jgi:hypothetical protein
MLAYCRIWQSSAPPSLHDLTRLFTRYELGTFSTLDEAVAACKQMVDEDLREFTKGKKYTADELYDHYTLWGSDPFIVALNPKDDRPSFSAWNYAKERSHVLVAQPEDMQR